MSQKDPLKDYRGYENIDDDVREILVAAGQAGSDYVLDAAKQINDAQHITQFLSGPAGKLVLQTTDGILKKLLKCLTAQSYQHSEVEKLCEDYRFHALSMGVLFQAVQEAGELQKQLEQEQIDDQPAADLEPYTEDE